MSIPTWLRSGQAKVGVILTLIVLVVGVAGPWLAPHREAELLGQTYGAADSVAPLGYDFLGRDVLSRTLHGGFSLIWMTVTAALAAMALGTAIGMLSGYLRGRVDQIVVWWADVLLAFPNVVLILLVVSMLGRSEWLIVATVVLAFLPGVVRLARASTLEVVGQEYVEVAQLLSYPAWRILLREVLPNIASPLLVHLGTMLTWGVGILGAVSFLGYGVQAPAADWGLMINENRAGMRIQPWAVVAPVFFIAPFALGTNSFAEGLSSRKLRGRSGKGTT
ncbi:ABC transporter permease [Rhodococcus globerulus]|uniref:ABC transporter permease n=1 Tax=Rhodococcus globerulus TaxID=33008 RepID=A0ABU4C689_RHOGO|nr:ABC transporter permease [Rhodococcus globerulus]MDV6271718.1 ABC transporter permease [Rhodococcus globerulus]